MLLPCYRYAFAKESALHGKDAVPAMPCDGCAFAVCALRLLWCVEAFEGAFYEVIVLVDYAEILCHGP